MDIIKNYDKYVRYMERKRYNRNQMCIDETNKRLVTISNLNKGSIGSVIDIRCPCGWKMSVYGTKQVPKNTDQSVAHSLKLILLGSNDDEIDFSTKIDIRRERVSEMVMMLGRMSYSDVNIKNSTGTEPEYKSDTQWYRFEQSFELKNEDHLVVSVINPDIDIDASKTRLALDLDMWEHP